LIEGGYTSPAMLKSLKHPERKAKAKDQHAQFVEAARRFGVDMVEESFKRAVGKIAKSKKPEGDQGG
jgi:hypothetical protein